MTAVRRRSAGAASGRPAGAIEAAEPEPFSGGQPPDGFWSCGFVGTRAGTQRRGPCVPLFESPFLLSRSSPGARPRLSRKPSVYRRSTGATAGTRRARSAPRCASPSTTTRRTVSRSSCPSRACPRPTAPTARSGVFVNFGEPGDVAADVIKSFTGDLLPALNDRFDMFAMDPRGVGRSRPAISCGGRRRRRGVGRCGRLTWSTSPRCLEPRL